MVVTAACALFIACGSLQVPVDSGRAAQSDVQAVVIATGSEPTVPDVYAGCLPWGSRDATGVDVGEQVATAQACLDLLERSRDSMPDGLPDGHAGDRLQRRR